MDRFEDLRTFVRVAELRSVSQAAAEFQRAPSAVSRRLKDLETRLQARLLSRTTRTIVLTAAGERLLARARRILADLDEAEDEVAVDDRSLAGSLRLTAPVSFGLRQLTPVIDDFLQAHPALTIDIDFSDRHVDIVANRIDMAIRIGQMSGSSLQSRRLAPIHHLVVASPGFWARVGMPETIADLTALPALVYTQLRMPDRWVWSSAGGESGQVPLTVRYATNNGDALLQAACAGIGIARLPTFIANEALERGELVPALPALNWGLSTLHAVFAGDQQLSARCRALIDQLATTFGDTPDWDECLRKHRAAIVAAQSIRAVAVD